MKIERQSPVEPGRLYRIRENEPRSACAKTDGIPGTDEVSVSAEARLRQELLRRLRELPDVREEVVTDLAQRLAAGSYTVEPEQLAGNIMKEILRQR